MSDSNTDKDSKKRALETDKSISQNKKLSTDAAAVDLPAALLELMPNIFAQEDDDDDGNEFEEWELKREHLRNIVCIAKDAQYTFDFVGPKKKVYSGIARIYRGHWFLSPVAVSDQTLDKAMTALSEEEVIECHLDNFESDDDGSDKADEEPVIEKMLRAKVWPDFIYWPFHWDEGQTSQEENTYCISFNHEGSDHVQ